MNKMNQNEKLEKSIKTLKDQKQLYESEKSILSIPIRSKWPWVKNLKVATNVYGRP